MDGVKEKLMKKSALLVDVLLDPDIQHFDLLYRLYYVIFWFHAMCHFSKQVIEILMII